MAHHAELQILWHIHPAKLKILWHMHPAELHILWHMHPAELQILWHIHPAELQILWQKKNLLPGKKLQCLLRSHKPSTFVGGKKFRFLPSPFLSLT